MRARYHALKMKTAVRAEQLITAHNDNSRTARAEQRITAVRRAMPPSRYMHRLMPQIHQFICKPSYINMMTKPRRMY